jgi:hypothetical protein
MMLSVRRDPRQVRANRKGFEPSPWRWRVFVVGEARGAGGGSWDGAFVHEFGAKGHKVVTGKIFINVMIILIKYH